MAIVTRVMGGDGDDVRGHVTFEVDYDDVRLRLTAVRCINNSTAQCWGRVTSIANPDRTYSTTFPANQTTVYNIPTGASQRLSITITANGRIDGVNYEFMWPV